MVFLPSQVVLPSLCHDYVDMAEVPSPVPILEPEESSVKWTNKALGMWSLFETKHFSIVGTTPRNAGYLNIDFNIGPYGLWVHFGRHTGIDLWFAEDRCKTYNIKFCRGKCYTCQIFAPMSRETVQAISKAMWDPNRPVRKLPPRKSE